RWAGDHRARALVADCLGAPLRDSLQGRDTELREPGMPGAQAARPHAMQASEMQQADRRGLLERPERLRCDERTPRQPPCPDPPCADPGRLVRISRASFPVA